MVLNVGDLAPNFELPDTELKMRTLEEFKGKKIVLSFIVAASSPVCEVELCTFRDSWKEISDMGAQIISISNDGPFANKAFAEKHNFGIVLRQEEEIRRAVQFLRPPWKHNVELVLLSSTCDGSGISL